MTMARSVEMNIDATGMVIRGYDPVAFFTEGRPVPGSPEFSMEYEGGTYLFSSAANREMFRANPERYAPRYGGFCAYGVAVGKKFDIDAGSWRIKNDKLYFNLNPQILETWSRDADDFIRKSEANWPRIRSKKASEL
jgi:YHS domain-containing protein